METWNKVVFFLYSPYSSIFIYGGLVYDATKIVHILPKLIFVHSRPQAARNISNTTTFATAGKRPDES